MAKKTSPEDLSNVITDYLNNYKENIDDDVIEVVDEVTKAAKEELIRTSPRRVKSRSNPYYRGWTVKLSKRKTGVYHKVIWNKTNYQLTHLLEFGHVKRNGTGWTTPISHIRPVEKTYKAEFVDKLEAKIRRTK